MSRLLLPLIFLSSLISKNSFAKDTYKTEVCKSTNYDFVYEGGSNIGGMYAFSLRQERFDNQISALPEIESDKVSTLKDAPIIFKEISATQFGEHEPSSYCGIEKREWHSEKTVQITMVSFEAAQKLGMKIGDEIEFICKVSQEIPDDSSCDEQD